MTQSNKSVRFRPIDFCHPAVLLGGIQTVFSPQTWMQSRRFRRSLVQSRNFYNRLTAAGDGSTIDAEESVSGTLKKNSSAKFATVGNTRSQKLVYPLLSIESLLNRIADVDVLAIGPRNEAELLTIRSFGFSGKRIQSIDLFSNSPWIDVMDMHEMDYADNSFDVIFCGWVLAYSQNPQRAVEEMIRVARPGAYICVGWDAFDLSKTTSEASVDTRPIQGSDDIVSLFGDSLEQTVFKGEIDKINGVVREQTVTVVRLNATKGAAQVATSERQAA